MKLILFLSLFSWLGTASEVDSFSQRDQQLSDSLYQLNKVTNNWLQIAAKKVKSCSKDKLIKAVKRKFTRVGWSKFETFVNRQKDIPKLRSPKDHIYSYFPGVGRPGTIMHLPKVMSPVFKANNHWIGSDKFSHFFNEGFNYYKKVMSPQGSIEKAFHYGKWMEGSFWGVKTTGVYSYADLAANYQGFLFYKELTHGLNPIFECSNNVWKQKRSFNWADYIDAGWDESINCNSFRDATLEKFFYKRLSEIESTIQINLSCPLDRRSCYDLREKYQHLADEFISPQCI